MNKLKNPFISLLWIALVFTSCSGQTSSKQNANLTDSISKKEQNLTIVRTLSKKIENVGCQLLDKEGNLWFSILGEGAYRYDGKSFTNFTTKDGLCNNYVSSIIQSRAGTILLGTKNGICQYDGTQFTTYPVPDTLNIMCMLEDKDGNLWFGVMGKGVYKYDGTNLTCILSNYEHSFFGEKYEKHISDILQDKMGNIWFSSWNRGGVWCYDGTTLTHFLPSADYYSFFEDEKSNAYDTAATKYVHSPDYITDDMIFSMTEDRDGNIWFATRRHGICYYNGTTFTTFDSKKGFDSNGATAILQDDQNGFWISTGDSGVWFYDGKTFKNFTEKDGLVNNAIMSMIKDKNGNIWMGTKYFGLSRFDGTTFTTFSQYEH
jgi:ligand-binding sensor domain-containing protein